MPIILLTVIITAIVVLGIEAAIRDIREYRYEVRRTRRAVAAWDTTQGAGATPVESMTAAALAYDDLPY